jgi:hypothetical protein
MIPEEFWADDPCLCWCVDKRRQEADAVCEGIRRAMGKRGYSLIDGARIIRNWIEELRLPQWFVVWPYAIKVLLPLEMAGTFVYVDDDVVLGDGMEKLWREEGMWMGRLSGPFGKVTNVRIQNELQSRFGFTKEDEGRWRGNSGVMCVPALTAGQKELYKETLRVWCGIERFDEPRFINDEWWWMLWMKYLSGLWFGQEKVLTLAEPFEFKRVLILPPALHFACNPEEKKKWVHYFNNGMVMNGVFVSRYQTGEEFNRDLQ